LHPDGMPTTHRLYNVGQFLIETNVPKGYLTQVHRKTAIFFFPFVGGYARPYVSDDGTCLKYSSNSGQDMHPQLRL